MVVGFRPDAEGNNHLAATVGHQLGVVERAKYFVLVSADHRVDIRRTDHHARFVSLVAAMFFPVFTDVF